MAALEPIDPVSDPRVEHCYAELNGKRYHYLLGQPPAGFTHTIFLIHGWPDLSMGWRNQIPLFLSLGFRVVCPDLMGFGGTDAPPVPPNESLQFYGYKRAADDVNELAQKLGATKILLGGHDWGGMVAYRIALWYPELVSHIFVVCTPYVPPNKHFVQLDDIVKTQLPNFTYQLHLASGEVEDRIRTKDQIRQFLNALYGGRTPNGQLGFDVRSGILFDNLGTIGQTRLMNDGMMDYYVEQYARNGVHGGLNWYRTRFQNYEDELSLGKQTIDVPVLFIMATKDAALPPFMSDSMEDWLPQLTRRSVETSHWALWEAPDAVNSHVREWLHDVLRSKSNL